MTNMTVANVADHWGCSDTFVYAQIEAGLLVSFKLGAKLIRIKQCEVEAYELRSIVVPKVTPSGPIEPPYSRTKARLARLAKPQNYEPSPL